MPPSQSPVPLLAWARLFSLRSGPPIEAATTQSNAGELSCSVQRAVEMCEATASCGCPSESVQWQVRPLEDGCGKSRSRLPGERTCTALHDLVPPDVSHAAMVSFCATAAIGP